MESECPMCLENFDWDSCTPCVIPCREGHVACFNCIVLLYEDPHIIESPDERCCLPCNDPQSPHFKCPICRDITHLRDNDVNSVQRIPKNEEDMNALIIRRRQLRRDAIRKAPEVMQLGIVTNENLENLKKILDKKIMDSRKVKTAGGVTGFVGGVMFIVGAALAIPSFGASIPLMVSGTLVGVAGGATAGAGGIIDLVFTKKVKEETMSVWNSCQEKYFDLCNTLHELQICDALTLLGIKSVASIGSTLGNTLGVIRLAVIAADASVDTAAGIFKVAAIAGRTFHVAGMVFASVLVVVDIISVVWNSIEIARGDPASFSKEIEKIQQKISDNCINQTNLKEVLQDIDNKML